MRVEFAERGFGDREQLQPHRARCAVAVFDGGVLAKATGLKTAVGQLRPLSRQKEEVARPAIRHVVGHRRGNGRKGQAKGGKPLLRR